LYEIVYLSSKYLVKSKPPTGVLIKAGIIADPSYIGIDEVFAAPKSTNIAVVFPLA
jgi:hypothetical protein